MAEKRFRVKFIGEKAYTVNFDQATADIDFESNSEVERMKNLRVGESMRLSGYATITRIK